MALLVHRRIYTTGRAYSPLFPKKFGYALIGRGRVKLGRIVRRSNPVYITALSERQEQEFRHAVTCCRSVRG